MNTQDLFKNNRSSKRLNESLSKTFGQKIDFQSFDTPKLEDARNKLRTQIYTARTNSGFNETIENEALTKAQWMHDAIVAELMDREEHIVDSAVQEDDSQGWYVSRLGQRSGETDPWQGPFDSPDEAQAWIDSETPDGEGFEVGEYPIDQLGQLENGEQVSADDEGGETDDGYALASAGHGSDEDYGDFGSGHESIETEGSTDGIWEKYGHYSKEDLMQEFPNLSPKDAQTIVNYAEYGWTSSNPQKFRDEVVKRIQMAMNPQEVEEGTSQHSDMSIAQDVYAENPDLDSEDDILNAAFPHVVKMMGGSKKRANYMFNYDEDFPGEMIGAYKWLQRQEHDVGEDVTMERDRDPEDWDEGNTEPANNFAIYINGKKWKVLPGRGTYADDHREKAQYQQLKDMCAKKSAATGKKWEVSITGENATESIKQEGGDYPDGSSVKTPDAKEWEQEYQKAVMAVKNAKTQQEYEAASERAGRIKDFLASKNHNESINTGDNMSNLREGEIQQASAIVTAKTMVDRVGRWIEELSGMENDTLLQLGDSIRDEMGQEQAKTFISTVAPAIQSALENLKTARETLSGGVRTLTGEEQPEQMLGGTDTGEPDMSAEPDAMNAEPGAEDGSIDDFAAAEPAVGGMETAGREQRESINRQNSLLKLLAG